MNNAITDVPGFQVGHAQDLKALTGCTVILCPPATVGGVDIRGSAAGTRQIDSLHPFHFVDEVHAVLFAGGSAFGLDSSGGVMQYLEERSVGYQTSAGLVPIVPTAILYDLGLGDGKVRPDRQMGYQACEDAKPGPVAEGSVGAGTGASVGKLYTIRYATKSGLGTASIISAGGIIVGALTVVNAFGDVVDPAGRRILAGTRDPEDPRRFADSTARIKGGACVSGWKRGVQNTTLGVVATNAKLSKRQAIKVSQMAQSGLARTISPVHSTVDGDLVFALSSGDKTEDVNTVGLMAEEALAQAVLRAVRAAEGMGGLPAYRDLHPQE